MEHFQRFCGPYRYVCAEGEYAYIPAQAQQKKEPSPFTLAVPGEIRPLNRQLDKVNHSLRYPIPPLIEEYDHPYQEKYVYPPIGPYIHRPFGSHHWKSETKRIYTWRDRNSKTFAAYKKHLFFPQEKILENDEWLEVDKAIEESRPIPREYDEVIMSNLQDQRERKWKQSVLHYPPWLCGKPYDPPERDPYCDDRYQDLKNSYPTWMYGKPGWMADRLRGPKQDEPLKGKGIAMNFPKTPQRSFGPTVREMPDSSGTSYNFGYQADSDEPPNASVGVKRETYAPPFRRLCSQTRDDYREYPIIEPYPRPKYCVSGPGRNAQYFFL